MRLAKLGPVYWHARLRNWPAPKPATEGYSLLVPVPGDLPVFLRLALAVCQHQESASRVETIVIPDHLTPVVKALVAEARPTWPGELRLQALPRPERWVLPRLANPGRNHALQLVTGVASSRATHIVLHDADLFLLVPGQLDLQFETCRDRKLACLGISPAWDPWFAEHGRQLAATWELCARVDWLRGFAPVLHMAHSNTMFGEEHVFDTTFYPQARTDPDLIGLAPSDDIVHFNYVISNYRKFTRRGERAWTDSRFRLLLVIVFVELFDRDRAASYRIPGLGEMGQFLGDSSGAIRFPAGETGAAEYKSFRELLGRALAGPWVAPRQHERAAAALAPFDRFYGYDDRGTAPDRAGPAGVSSPTEVGPPLGGPTTEASPPLGTPGGGPNSP